MGSAETIIGSEEQAVLLMRYRRFRALGIERVYARMLAKCEVDLHKAERMREKGATPEQIARILL